MKKILIIFLFILTTITLSFGQNWVNYYQDVDFKGNIKLSKPLTTISGGQVLAIDANGVISHSDAIGSANSVNSGEIIGDFLYLFQTNDTIIIDVSSLNIKDSLWFLDNDTLKTYTQTALKFSVDSTIQIKSNLFAEYYSGYNNEMSNVLFGGGVKLKFLGERALYPNGSFIYDGVQHFDGFGSIWDESGRYLFDADSSYFVSQGIGNSQGLGETFNLVRAGDYEYGSTVKREDGVSSYIDFDNGDTTATNFLLISKADNNAQLGADFSDATNFIQNRVIVSKDDVLFQLANNGVFTFTKFNYNGIVLPYFASDPIGGELGAIYYNTLNNEFRVYDGSGWYTLLHDKPLPTYTSDTDADAALASGKYYKLTGDRTIYQIP